ncbi:hypothetical protein GCM10007242_14070 [Pigmentiphaga litoralis]|nr:hypothetical protein GCM10007242_14070 [Pigmentiphaga litoralis]
MHRFERAGAAEDGREVAWVVRRQMLHHKHGGGQVRRQLPDQFDQAGNASGGRTDDHYATGKHSYLSKTNSITRRHAIRLGACG